jgi:DNA-binding GntR family transcriptional regulator
VAALRERLEAMRDALALEDRQAYGYARDAFRDALVVAAGNGKLHETYRRCVSELRLSRTPAPRAESLAASYAAHRAILNALASRAADEAGGLMRAQGGEYSL